MKELNSKEFDEYFAENLTIEIVSDKNKKNHDHVMLLPLIGCISVLTQSNHEASRE